VLGIEEISAIVVVSLTGIIKLSSFSVLVNCIPTNTPAPSDILISDY
jgi:hypothetical protein